MEDKRNQKQHLKLVSVHLPPKYIELLEELVARGLYPSRSEAIRVAVRDLIARDLWRREHTERRMIA